MSRRLARLATAVAIPLVLGARPVAAQEAVEYYATDALGSVRVVFASNGTVKGRMDFGPYGEQLTTAEGIGQKVFAQITFDGETSMDYAEARMFQLRTGRFNAPDPVYAGLEEPQRWNRYTYARNNPLLFVDPTGRQESAGPDPSLCTAAIKEQNPLDFHCQATKNGGSRGGTSGSFVTWLIDFILGTEPVWSAESNWTEDTQSGAYAPSTTVQVLSGAALLATPAASKVAKAVGKRLAERGAAKVESALANAATRAVATVGPGRGGAYGTRVHSVFEAEVNALGNRSLSTEVSYLNGQPVPRGTLGSVRLDVVYGPLDSPISAFDLKTGSASLTPARIGQIQSHVPGGPVVPVVQIRP